MLLVSLLGSREAKLSVEKAWEDPAASWRRTNVAYAPPEAFEIETSEPSEHWNNLNLLT